LEARDNDKKTPLFYAVHNGHIDIVRLLLQEVYIFFTFIIFLIF
jgi:ankyrin repeat protein